MIIMEQSGMGAVISPGQIGSEMEALNNAIDSLNKDVTSQLIATGRETLWVNRWRDFRREFLAWYEKNKSFWGRLWGSTYDEAESYRKRFETWRDDFEVKAGGTVSGPKLPPPPVKSDAGGADMFTWIKRVAIIGGVALGALYVAPYVVPFAARQVRKTRSTMGEAT